MSRLSEVSQTNKKVEQLIGSNEQFGPKEKLEAAKLDVLKDISATLAIIADRMGGIR